VADAPTDLTQAVAANRWYHTIELAPGVVTPGFFDDRANVARIPWPDSLEGLRCLDVGTMDGFWAFEMERRGAAEVVATELMNPSRQDWPFDLAEEQLRPWYTQDDAAARGRGFAIVADALASKVQHVDANIYELSPERFGEFDLVFVGRVIQHLRNPIGALEALRSVCRGRIIWLDIVKVPLMALHPRRAVAQLHDPTSRRSGLMAWWHFNPAGMELALRVAGFDPEARSRLIPDVPGPGGPRAREAPLKNRAKYRARLVGQNVAIRARVRERPTPR
jgi:tRNA (mo5U34)-methyltransferase